MGSGQSSTADRDTVGNQPRAQSASSHLAENTSLSSVSESSRPDAAKAKKVKPPKDESGYARAQRICRKKKRAYDACYTAALSSKEEDCSDLFEAYQTCFLRAMSTDMKKRGVKVSENSMIGEYQEEMEEEESNR